MNPFQILIVEDKHSYALDLENLVSNLGLKSVFFAQNSEEALEKIHAVKPDLILLNTAIGGHLNGIQLAKAISALSISTIFITDRKDRDSYQQVKNTNLVGYLIKPVNSITLEGLIELSISKFHLKQNATEEALKRPAKKISKEYIFIKKGNLLCKVLFSEIDWINSEKNYCTVISNGKKYPLKTSLRKIAQQLPPQQFFQIHKSYIVRLDNIKNIDLVRSKVLINSSDLPLGRSFKNALLEQIGVLR